MNTTKSTVTKPGTEDHWGPKAAAWGVVLMVIWLVWNQ
jgi:hypothetical protein